MSILNKLISGITAALCLFGCSNSNPEQERKDILRWIDFHLAELTQQLEADIKNEIRGFYPHAEKTDYQSKGYINYLIKQKTGQRMDLSSHSLVTVDDIKNTDGYRKLEARTKELGYQVKIGQVDIEGDEVDSHDDLDEYIDDVYHYFVVTVAGW